MSLSIFAQRTQTLITTPALILGYDANRAAGNIVHELVGGGVGVTLIPAMPRSGTLQLFYLTEAAAFAALTLLARSEVWVLFDIPATVRSPREMTFVVATPGLSISLDPLTNKRWIVSCGFQETPNG